MPKRNSLKTVQNAETLRRVLEDAKKAAAAFEHMQKGNPEARHFRISGEPGSTIDWIEITDVEKREALC